MRTVFLGFLVVAGLVIVAAGATPNRNEVFAQRVVPHGSVAGEGQLIALSATVGDKYQQVTVIDPKQRVMSVYHVEMSTGKITLRSVRNIHWDLQMMEFNGENPLPQEIRSLLEPR
jgi:hypothetical protein